MTQDFISSDDEPIHTACTTAHLVDQLQLFGFHPETGEPDPRPMPTPDRAEQELASCVEILANLMADTPLERDSDDVLWSFAQLFHRRISLLDRALDDNEQSQRRAQQEQDGSEIKSVELERLIAQGAALIDRRNMFEALRDIAASQYEIHVGSSWIPRAGSMTTRKTLTASVIDSRDYIAAKRKADIEPLLPAGPRVAFTGGADFNDQKRIWAALDQAHARHSNMVLLHGGSPKGAERIAACWANQRKVPQIVFKPDWARDRNAAPFKRNDAMLETLPIGVIAFPGSGIHLNLADKACKMGIPVWKFGGA